MARLLQGPATASAGFDPMADARRSARVGLLVLAVAVGGFGTWAALAPLSGAVIVSGV